jgi:hypothetical protein
MSSCACTLPSFSLANSLAFVKQELKRIPRGVRIGLRKLGLFEDLIQELHLAYFLAQKKATGASDINRALHAAGERFRYREIVRRAQREVAEELAGAAYHSLVYGNTPETNGGAD